MKVIIAFAVIAAVSALQPPYITGTTPPAIYCPNEWCDGKYDGNYEIRSAPNYFLQCVSGLAYCQPCFPLSLVFSGKCNQCLYNRYDACYTTDRWYPATTYSCPDECPHKGYDFSGNINDPHQPRQYVACWKGVTVGCVACPEKLEFNEKWNACLYEGKYKTAPAPHGYGYGPKTYPPRRTAYPPRRPTYPPRRPTYPPRRPTYPPRRPTYPPRRPTYPPRRQAYPQKRTPHYYGKTHH